MKFGTLIGGCRTNGGGIAICVVSISSVCLCCICICACCLVACLCYKPLRKLRCCKWVFGRREYEADDLGRGQKMLQPFRDPWWKFAGRDKRLAEYKRQKRLATLVPAPQYDTDADALSASATTDQLLHGSVNTP